MRCGHLRSLSPCTSRHWCVGHALAATAAATKQLAVRAAALCEPSILHPVNVKKEGVVHQLLALALQVSRRFVPLVCGPTLAIMDQHAAAERVRLEELQQEVGSPRWHARRLLLFILLCPQELWHRCAIASCKVDACRLAFG